MLYKSRLNASKTNNVCQGNNSFWSEFKYMKLKFSNIIPKLTFYAHNSLLFNRTRIQRSFQLLMGLHYIMHFKFFENRNLLLRFGLLWRDLSVSIRNVWITFVILGERAEAVFWFWIWIWIDNALRPISALAVASIDPL